jgi:hypothetical protein
MRTYVLFPTKAMNLLGANDAPLADPQSPTHCSRYSPQPCPEHQNRGPNALPSFSHRGLCGSYHEGRAPSGCESRSKGDMSECPILPGGSPSSTARSRFSPQPCPEHQNRGPNALPSYSRRGLRGSYHEGRTPSGCEPLPLKMESARMVQVLADPYDQRNDTPDNEGPRSFIRRCRSYASYLQLLFTGQRTFGNLDQGRSYQTPTR